MQNIIVPIVGVFFLGVTLRFTLRLLAPTARSSASDPIYHALHVISCVFIVSSITAAFLLAGGLLSVLLAIITVVVVVVSSADYGVLERHALMSLLAVSVEKQVPIEPTLSALAMENGGTIGLWSARLAEKLEQGTPLPEAIQQCRRGLPQFAPVFARIGENSGDLAPALREAAAIPRWANWAATPKVSSGPYFLLVVSIGVGILTFVMIKIVPAFEQIFFDFEMELPGITRFVIGFTRALVTFLPAILLLLILLALLGFILTQYGRRLPFKERIGRVHASVILRILALVTERNYPLARALRELAESYPRGFIQRRLRLAADRIEQGADWTDSLRRQKLIGPREAALLASAQRVGNLPWAMRELSDSILRRRARRLASFDQVGFAFMILALGAVVGLYVVALFYPLVLLISSLV